MPKLPIVRSGDVIKIAEKIGFSFSRQKGSHAIYKNLFNGGRITVPIHSGQEISTMVLIQIIKDLGLTKESFVSMLKGKK